MNYESDKSERISKILIDGKDKSVSFLSTDKTRMSLSFVK